VANRVEAVLDTTMANQAVGADHEAKGESYLRSRWCCLKVLF